MLSKEANELLTQVGPGTPMGDLIRQYWLPALIASELPQADGPPLRVRLLGENLIAFRDTSGRVGLLPNHCAHRGASLFFGRNEESGLRCVYHGWKYDVHGRCIDMPNEPAFRWTDSGGRDSADSSGLDAQVEPATRWTDSGGRDSVDSSGLDAQVEPATRWTDSGGRDSADSSGLDAQVEPGTRWTDSGGRDSADSSGLDAQVEPGTRWTDSGGRDSAEIAGLQAQSAIRNPHSAIRLGAYPCQERAGVIWTYMGPREEPPSLPDLEWISLPESHLQHSKIFRECNWVQALAGDIDSSHTSFLHSSVRPESQDDRDRGRYSDYKHRDRAPRLEVMATDYGAMYGARRMAEEGMFYWRIAQFLFPFYTMVPPIGPRAGVGTRIWVPVDDEHVVFWSVSANPLRPVDVPPPPQPLRPFGRLKAQGRLSPARGEGVSSLALDGAGSAAAPLAGHYLPDTTDWPGRWRLAANKANDYFLDRQVQRTETFTGIDGTNLQDQAITESMGPISDRTQEHLGSADAMIIQVRRRLIDAARALRDDGVTPPGVDDPSVYRVRSASLVLPEDVDWVEGAREHLVARPGVPVATV